MQDRDRQALAAAYCFRGHGLTEKRELDAAPADLNEAIKLDPTSPAPTPIAAGSYRFKRDLDHAMPTMTRRIRIDPTFALAYNNRGDAWFSKGDLDRALTDFDAAIKHNPSLAIAYGNAAMSIIASATGPVRSPTTACRSS
jgi:tetratricopeptide (TPR) repeat protein